MNEKLLHQVEKLDKEYFGPRTLPQLISALDAQVRSMKKESTFTNVRKQLGDALFVIVSIARNKKWDLDELLEDVITKLMNRMQDRHYYEAHITIEPVFGERHAKFRSLCVEHKFSPATLLMQKRKSDTPERSQNDAFCTGRSISYSDIEDRMLGLLGALESSGFQVWRYKIESTLLDSRHGDELYPLKLEKLPQKEKEPRAPAVGALSGRKKR